MPGPSNCRHKKSTPRKKNALVDTNQTPTPPNLKKKGPTDTLPCLYIPDDSAPDHPVEQRTLFFPPGTTFDDVVCPLLQCRMQVAETIYSEYLSDVYEGRRPAPPATEFVYCEMK
ncbi:hypothetical protein HYPSUDRAFT_84763 [Hypholoma sublateritium FD-334 SS-4]|uniref:Uncharacterized protein n=1 Tax=Hypholoma sublateritium (strain FD-334 SS-4) TaxID=945553 RepID=A0A0D2PBF2_HYPSF|nr:hypothetical protein HYPSUDRAFT_84763 [Hypholoma sublateritium FD-334 SS-4]